MAKTYNVTSPLVIAKLQGGTYVHLYEGAPLPEDVDADQLKQLVDQKMVAEADTAPVDDPADDPGGGGKPAGNASLEKWQEYARSQGASDADLDGVSRDDLRDRYV